MSSLKTTHRWAVAQQNPELEKELSADLGIPGLVARIMVAHGITSIEEGQLFLTPSLDRDWADPLVIPGMAAVADRVERAIRSHERIAVFGDFDVDGITSTCLLTEALRSFGADVTTAWGLSGRLDGIIWMVTEALGVSITTFSAQNFGARNYERMRKGYHTSLVLSFMLIGGLSAVLLVFSGPLSRLFVDDALISAYTTTILHFIAPFYAIFSIIENASGSIRGAGVSLQPMMLTIFGTVVLRVIWVFAIMPFDPSLEHVLLVYPVTWLITATMFTIYHHSGNWLGRATA